MLEYNNLISKGSSAFTEKQLQDLARDEFSTRLRGRNKEEKFRLLLNLCYQRDYSSSLRQRFSGVNTKH